MRRSALWGGILLGVLLFIHLWLDQGRGRLPQLVWPILAGAVPVGAAARRSGATRTDARRLALRTILAAAATFVVLGTPHTAIGLAETGVEWAMQLPVRFAVATTAAIATATTFAALSLAVMWLTSMVAIRPGPPNADRKARPLHAWVVGPFGALFAAGMVGVVSLVPVVLPMLRDRPPSQVVQLSPTALVFLTLVTPTLMLAISVAVGLKLAPRVGLRSRLATRACSGVFDGSRFRDEVGLAVVAGAGIAVLIVLVDALVQPLLGEEWRALTQEQRWSVAQLVAGLLYGGITEELMLRWGLLTIVAWVGWRALQRGVGAPHPGVMWTAVVVAALLFGLGHVPALAAMTTPEPALVARTVGLNMAGGIVFGWLYWRRSLEAAMVAHATGHILFAVAALTVMSADG